MRSQSATMSDYEIALREELNASNEPTLKPDDVDIMTEAFSKNDGDQSNTVPMDRLFNLMSDADASSVPNHELRHFATSKNIKMVTPANFVMLYMEVKRREAMADPKFKSGLSRVSSRKVVKVKRKGDDDDASNRLTSVQMYSKEEVRAFSQWINSQLKSHPKVGSLIPIDETDPNDFFAKLGDGIILCLMMQKVSENLIDDRAINFKCSHPIHKHENLNLAIGSATSIGCVTTNQHPTFIMEGRPNMCLGLTWQIIRAGLFVKISLQENPYLKNLLRDGETIEDLLKLSQEDLLLRWVNYQLENNDNYEGGPISNFSRDIKDSVAYQYLMEEIQPPNTGLVASPQSHGDLTDRAEATLQMADRLDCRQFVTPTDIVKGQPRLNLAFVANLYNNHPNLKPIEVEEIQETREEKTYRNWMNSLGIKPQINYLYTDLQNGVALLKLEDRIQPGIINWKRVNMPPYKPTFALMRRTENCTYAVETAPSLDIKVIGVRGHDVCEGNKMLTLGIVWQLMRAYTLSLLTQLGGEAKLKDADIVAWFNQKTGKSIKTLKDSSIQDSTLIQKILRELDSEVEMADLAPATDYATKMENARYVISIARRMGAVVYTLPEDIVESQPKMVLCLIITLMVLEKQLQGAEALE